MRSPEPLRGRRSPVRPLLARELRDLAAGRALWVTALLLSIHQLADAERVCDRFVLLAAGRVRGEGTLPELRAATGLAAGGLEEVFLVLA